MRPDLPFGLVQYPVGRFLLDCLSLLLVARSLDLLGWVFG